MAQVRQLRRCKQCGYEWFQRSEQEPIFCPNQECRSRRWNSDEDTRGSSQGNEAGKRQHLHRASAADGRKKTRKSDGGPSREAVGGTESDSGSTGRVGWDSAYSKLKGKP